VFRCQQTPGRSERSRSPALVTARGWTTSLKDITAPLLENIRLARSATVDLVGTTQLGDALASPATIEPDGRDGASAKMPYRRR
jgi:hypothetical protein